MMGSKFVLASFLFMGLAVGCSQETTTTGVTTQKYNELVDQYNVKAREVQALRDQAVRSGTELIVTNQAISDVDRRLREFQQIAQETSQAAQQFDPRSIKNQLTKFEDAKTGTLNVIAVLEGQASIKNVEMVKSNTVRSLANYERYTDLREYAKKSGELTERLEGLRNVVLTQYSAIVSQANEAISRLEIASRLIEAPAGAAPVESPFISNRDEGGVLQGSLRTSTTGQPVANAKLGFKFAPGDAGYFYETRTDTYGQYTTPTLRPGQYYVDIQRDGFVPQKNQPVVIQRGPATSENRSLSEPLQKGAWRITMSWTNEKLDAVRDVDSYLTVPGASSPIYFEKPGNAAWGAYLDRDDTDWIGPETVTITTVRAGTYVYYVNAFSDRQYSHALGNSDVRIQVYKEDQLIATLRVPTGLGQTYEAFRIEDGVFRATGHFTDSLWVSRR